MNASDATLTGLATAHTGSTAGHPAPNAPAASSFDLILHAAAGSALGNSGTPYTLTISAIDLTCRYPGLADTYPPPVLRRRQRVETQRHRPGLPVHPDLPGSRPRRPPRRPAGRPHAAVRGLADQPGRLDCLNHPQQTVRARLAPGRPRPRAPGHHPKGHAPDA